MDKNIYKLYKGIKKDIKYNETYNTGLIGEALIIASYKQMTLDQLEKIRFIINKIIKKKKEFKRVNDSILHFPVTSDCPGDTKKK